MVDYFSKCPEVARLSNKTSEAVIMAMNRHLLPPWRPREGNADNMPFDSLKFKSFASEWEFEVVTR